MKLYRNALILVIILAVAVGAYLLVRGLKSGTDGDGTDPTQQDDIVLYDAISLDVARFKVENQNGTFEFSRKDTASNWEVVQPADLIIDADKVNSLITNLMPIGAEKEIVDAAGQDLSLYGLDKPAVIEITLYDGTGKTFLLGGSVSTGYANYIMEKDGSKIYTVGSYRAEAVLLDRMDVRSDALFSFNAADVSGLSMDKGGMKFFSALKAAGGSDWKLDYPLSADADIESIGGIIDSLSKNTTAEYIEDNAADLSKYGLDNPSYAFGIDLPTGTIRLLLGNLDKETGMYFAKLENDADVFKLTTENFPFLDKPLTEIVSRFIYIVNIGDVNRIVVNIDGITTVCGIQATKDDPDSDKFTVNGKDATMSDEKGKQPFRKYYQSLIGVFMSDIELDAVPAGKAEITITYYLKTDPGVVKVELIPKNDNYYYAMRNGVYTGQTVEKRQFDQTEGVRETYGILMKAIEDAE